MTNERAPTIRRILSRNHELIGPSCDEHFGSKNPFGIYIRGIVFACKAVWFGVRHPKSYDLIFCENLAVYGLIGCLVSIVSRRRVIYDAHHNGMTYCRELRKPLAYKLLTRVAETTIRRFAETTIAVSQNDRQQFIECGFTPAKVVTIPTAADLTVCDRKNYNKSDMRTKLGLDPNKRLLLFIGKRDYPPNMESAEWICTELAPALSQQFDDIQILLTGAGPIPASIHGSVEFTGFVPDIYDLIASVDICISPTWTGVGIMTKVIDSLSCGKPTVVSEFVTDGIPELVDSYNVMVAGTKTEFIDKTVFLLKNADVAQDIGIRAHKMIEEHYDWDKWQSRLDETILECAITR
ncbi:MAG: glycosyltransferase family 4 protein [Planctomycetes bacterium]|nr:glycosyltransferase family 4 protein [Planctomycetota bacterium]